MHGKVLESQGAVHSPSCLMGQLLSNGGFISKMSIGYSRPAVGSAPLHEATISQISSSWTGGTFLCFLSGGPGLPYCIAASCSPHKFQIVYVESLLRRQTAELCRNCSSR
ncbi:hypothetical protein MN608_04334 [Microdochium nivale]|nr:hypothetical protein MN608_04334 [Microdochium nivale]